MLAQDAQFKLIGPPVAIPGTATANVIFHAAIMKWALADVNCRVFHSFKFGLCIPKFITLLPIEEIDCFYSDIGFIYVRISLLLAKATTFVRDTIYANKPNWD
jgi:hypothetical protein